MRFRFYEDFVLNLLFDMKKKKTKKPYMWINKLGPAFFLFNSSVLDPECKVKAPMTLISLMFFSAFYSSCHLQESEVVKCLLKSSKK